MQLKRKKFWIIATVLVYFASFFLQSNFTFFQVWAQEKNVPRVNIVAVLVDDKIYDSISSDVSRYASNYIQGKLSDTKALVMPLDLDNISAYDIHRMMENIYFDGLENVNSSLIWLVMIWDIPLPVINQDGYVFPSVYPYVDFENQKYDLLEIYDEKLAEYGYEIYKYRNEFINKLKNKIKNIHNNITKNKENIEIEYISNCENKEEFLKLLKERKKLDIIKGYTTKGVHRDDFKIYINELPVDIYGSQGQNRTAVLSLKLSELQVIYDEIGENPILLLDDFMSELDEFRRTSFLENIKDTQVIITCTDKLELQENEFEIFNVKNGEINFL